MIRPKPLRDQVVVILGASSGFGRESALQCAAAGFVWATLERRVVRG